MPQFTVGIFLFNEVEVLDFAGPFEVFSLARFEGSEERAFRVCTVARTKDPVHARNGLTVLPEFDFLTVPQLDLLIVPGGYGAEELEIHEQATLDWLRSVSCRVSTLASVCTGAFLLAEAGLLNGKRATTHWMDIDRLAREYPQIRVVRNVKFVDEGNVLTAGGISAGINMSLHIVKQLLGKSVAKNTARRMEYDISVF